MNFLGLMFPSDLLESCKNRSAHGVFCQPSPRALPCDTRTDRWLSPELSIGTRLNACFMNIDSSWYLIWTILGKIKRRTAHTPLSVEDRALGTEGMIIALVAHIGWAKCRSNSEEPRRARG